MKTMLVIGAAGHRDREGGVIPARDLLDLLVRFGTAWVRCARRWGMTDTEIERLHRHCVDRAGAAAPAPPAAGVAIDTKMGCVERAVARRLAAT